jgi:hypothetical protein
MNWKQLKKVAPSNSVEASMRKIAQLTGKNLQHFPELALIILHRQGQPHEVYSLMHNRVKKNISFIFGEETNLDLAQDSFIITKKLAGPSPQIFFSVHEGNLASFADEVARIKNIYDYLQLCHHWGVSRTEKRFWSFYDFAQSYFAKLDPVEASVLDLSKYAY